MVRDLERVAAEVVTRERVLGARLDVAGEQERAASVAQAQHDRVVVRRSPAGRRPEHVRLDGAEAEAVAAHDDVEGHARAARRQGEACELLVVVRGAADEGGARAEALDDVVQSVNVVGVRVRRQHVVEARQTPPPEVLGDGRVADAARVGLELFRVPFVRARRAEARAAAAVHEQRRAVGHRDERGVALPHVEEVHAQAAVRRRRAEGVRDDDESGRDGHPPRGFQQPPAACRGASLKSFLFVKLRTASFLNPSRAGRLGQRPPAQECARQHEERRVVERVDGRRGARVGRESEARQTGAREGVNAVDEQAG